MRVLLAFDKFKDALSAPTACQIAAEALRQQHPDWTTVLAPQADGGEGFCEILTLLAGGRREKITVSGPRQHPVTAELGWVAAAQIPAAARALLPLPATAHTGHLAIVEMATASGLALLPPDQRDPWQTSTFGTGQLLRAAAERGARHLLLGIGGSATNDLGLGALAALGYTFSTADGTPVPVPIPAAWPRIDRIAGQPPMGFPALTIACDVANPLLGPQGAAAVYGPQKGLRPEGLAPLEHCSERLARMLCAHVGAAPEEQIAQPGAGAAGGLGFGLSVGLGAQFVPGAPLVGAWLDLDAKIASVDLVITGEGRFDGSSAAGKGPAHVLARAIALGRPVWVLAGRIEAEAQRAWSQRTALAHFAAITPEGMPLPEALQRAPELLAATVTRVR